MSSSQPVIFFLASGVGRPLSEISGPAEFTELPSPTKPLPVGFRVRRLHHLHDRQIEFFGKFKIALVMRRHGHDRARAITGQHIVRDPDRNFFSVDRIDGKRAGENAGLFLGQFSSFQVRFFGNIGFVSRHCLALFRQT